MDVSVSKRISCKICGFLAKNDHGLSIHMRKHKRVINIGEVVDSQVFDEDVPDQDLQSGCRWFRRVSWVCYWITTPQGLQ